MSFRGIAALGLIAVILVASGQRSPLLAQSDAAGQTLQLVNQVRARHGLTPFQYDPALAAAAQNQAEFNAANGLYGHSGAGGSRPQDRANAAGFSGYVVENVVGGWDLSPEQGVTWWVNSPVHYNTLITTRYAYAGTGYATNGRQRHFTLVVGRIADGVPEQEAPIASAPAIVAPIVLSQPAEDGSIVHTVKVGQTLWAIAARYQATLEDLRLFNNLSEAALLRPGDQLIIRLAEGQEPPPTPTPPLSHVVREGETLWTIAARFRLQLADLLWFNNLTESSLIRPGDELIIRLAPGQLPPPTPTPQVSHIVQDGQSVWSIAALYGLSVDALLALNDLDASVILQPGDELRIRPVETATAAPVPQVATSANPGETLASAGVESETVLVATRTPAPELRPTTAPPLAPTRPISQTKVDSNRTEPERSTFLAQGMLALATLLTLAAGVVLVYVRRTS